MLNILEVKSNTKKCALYIEIRDKFCNFPQGNFALRKYELTTGQKNHYVDYCNK